MSWLDKVTTDPSRLPLRICLYGVEGVGKTTFAASAPDPIFIGPEDGFGNLRAPRFDPAPNSWSEIRAALGELAGSQHRYRTVVLDTIDWFETLLWKHICDEAESATIEGVGGGFGKGYTAAFETWSDLMADELARIRSRGIGIIALAHAHSKKWTNPNGVDSDRFTLKLNDKAAAKWKEWSDVLLFANFEDKIVTREKNLEKAIREGRGKAVGQGKRVLHTTRSGAFDAKNRYSLPVTVDLSWPALDRLLPKTSAAEAAVLRTQIDALLPVVDLPADVLAKTREGYARRGEDLPFLRALLGKLDGLERRVENAPATPATTSGAPPPPAASPIDFAAREGAIGDQAVLDIRAQLGIPAAGPVPAEKAEAYTAALTAALEAA